MKKRYQAPLKPKGLSTKTDQDQNFLTQMNALGVKPLEELPINSAQGIEAETLPLVFSEAQGAKTKRAQPKYAGLHPQPIKKAVKRCALKPGFEPDAQLDLHGQTLDVALKAAENFINRSIQQGYGSLLIITGKGINSFEQKGVLKKGIWNWLQDHPKIKAGDFRWAPLFLGGDGAILIWL